MGHSYGAWLAMTSLQPASTPRLRSPPPLPLGGWAQEGMSLNPALDVAGSLRPIPAAAMWHYKVGHRYYRVGHPALSNVSPTPMVQ